MGGGPTGSRGVTALNEGQREDDLPEAGESLRRTYRKPGSHCIKRSVGGGPTGSRGVTALKEGQWAEDLPEAGESLRSMLLYMLMKTMRQQSRMGPRMAPSRPMQYIPPAMARPVRNG